MANLFGFELETIGNFNKWELCKRLNEMGVATVVEENLVGKDRGSYVFNGMYSLVDDGSIKPGMNFMGVEIRSFVASLDELDKFKPLFAALKVLKVSVNQRCGLHIHASNEDKSVSAIEILEKTEKESVRVRRCRKKYSTWNTKKEKDVHYHAVNQRSPNHVEFRWFNGAVDFRYVCKMVRLVDSYIKS